VCGNHLCDTGRCSRQIERAREYSRKYRQQKDKWEAIKRYQRSYMRSYRYMDELFKKVLVSGEEVSLAALSEKISAAEKISFRSATLYKMIRRFGTIKGTCPLTEVEEDIYKLNANYYNKES